MIQAVMYLRVSGDGQIEKDGFVRQRGRDRHRSQVDSVDPPFNSVRPAKYPRKEVDRLLAAGSITEHQALDMLYETEA